MFRVRLVVTETCLQGSPYMLWVLKKLGGQEDKLYLSPPKGYVLVEGTLLRSRHKLLVGGDE